MEEQELIEKLRKEIIQQLNLEDLNPEDIDPDAALFGEGLGLDSIDALEIIVLLEKNYGIKIEDPKEGKKIFASIRTLAKYIIDHQKA
ncbi:MAG TPA: phosphopantetheine-binding protein [Bacteroidales bacterium]|nr:acyl carrier protein [Bacteroidales bacterium]HNZ43332.1 phosphopantetheine-binding protein [Bacteroidales bacterium]HOH84445.1 phosphopantetheine-binding protein [Bacteroidales bacterium]HPB26047.1 phosphopantetheine-binding protein [Bacteroidales bacterium]HPI31363.1 phosphopantetheine-binding protein [Bacteroidales bacterium]